MLVSSDRTTVVSSLGRVDGGALWLYSDRIRSARLIRLGKARYLSLREGVDDYFAVVHYAEDHAAGITVHRFPDVERVLARVVVGNGNGTISGDIDALTRVPRYYTASVATPAWTDFGLITVDTASGRIRVDPFPWFTNDRYDKGYQGVVGVTEIPNSHLLLVSVQRSSTVIIHDPTTTKKVGEVRVGNRAGNSALYFRKKAPELWADDYDTLVRLDTTNWRVLDRRRLQRSAFGTMQSIGKFTIDPAEELCTVARPFSGDVVAIDMRTFKTKMVARTTGQPIEAAMIAGHRVLARNSNGATLVGEFQRKWWFA